MGWNFAKRKYREWRRRQLAWSPEEGSWGVGLPGFLTEDLQPPPVPGLWVPTEFRFRPYLG